MKAARIIRWLVYPVLVLLCALIVVGHLLWFTEAGAARILSMLDDRVPGLTFVYEGGTMATGVEVSRLRYEIPKLRVEAARLRLRPGFYALFGLQVGFEELTAQSVDVHWESGEASDGSSARVDIPVPVLFQDIRLRDVSVRYGETPRRQIETLDGRLRLQGETLRLRDIRVGHSLGNVAGDFEMTLNAPYAMMGEFAIDAPVARARGQFSGDSGQIAIKGATLQPYPASFAVDIDPGQSPLFSVNARSEGFVVGSDVVLSHVALFATGDADAYRYRMSASVTNPFTPDPVEATVSGNGSTEGLEVDALEGTSSTLSLRGAGHYRFADGRLGADIATRWNDRELTARVELREALSDRPEGIAVLDFAGNVLDLDLGGGTIDGRLTAANLSAVYAGASGKIEGTGRFELAGSKVELSLNGTELAFEQRPLGQVRADYRGNLESGDLALDWRHSEVTVELMSNVHPGSGRRVYATIRSGVVVAADRRWRLGDAFAIRQADDQVRLDDHCWSDGAGKICIAGARIDARSVALDATMHDLTTAMLTTRESRARLEFDRRDGGHFEGRLTSDRVQVGGGFVFENVRLELGGQPANYRYDGSASAFVSGRSLDLGITGTGSTDSLDLERVMLASGEDRLEFSGRYVLDQPLLRGEIDGILKGRDLTGEVSLAGAGLERLDGKGRIAVAGNELVIDADGTGSLSLGITASNLRGLREGVEGQLSATAELQVATKEFRLTASGTGLKIGDHELAELHLDANGAGADFVASANGAGWRYDAWDLGDVTMEYRGSLRSADLTLAWGNPSFDVDLASTLGLHDDVVSGSLARGRVTVGPQEWQLSEETAFALSPGSANVADHCWAHQASSVCIRNAGYADSTGAFTALLVELPVELAELRFAPEVTLKGALNVGVHGEVDTSGASPTYAGHVSVNMPKTRIGYFDDRERVLDMTAEITLDAGRLKGALDIAGVGREKLNVDVTIPAIDDPRALTATASLATGDLGIVTAFVPQLDQAKGTITSSLEIDTTRGRRRARVSMNVTDDASVVIPAAGITLKNMTMTARTEDEDIVFDVGATSGEGRMRVAGNISSPLTAERRLDATIEGERFALLKRHDMSLIASSAITVGYDNDRRLDVGGNIEVVEGAFVLRNGSLQVRRASDDVVVVSRTGETATGNKLYLDLDVEVRKFNMQLAGLNADVEGNVRLTQSPASPRRAVGNLRLVGGTFSRYGQSFDIDRGRLIFGGPLDNPTVDIVNTRTIQERDRVVSVSLILSGPANNISSTLVSSPAMSDARALSYLVLGRPLTGASSAEGQSLSAAAFAFGLKRALPITEEIGSALGLSELTVASDIDSTNVIAGKRLSPELYVEYKYDVFGRVGGFLFNYQLTDRLSLETYSGETKSTQLTYTFD